MPRRFESAPGHDINYSVLALELPIARLRRIQFRAWSLIVIDPDASQRCLLPEPFVGGLDPALKTDFVSPAKLVNLTNI